jgi:hypothetical protein
METSSRQAIAPASSGRRHAAVWATTIVAALFWCFVLTVFTIDRHGGDMRGLLCLSRSQQPPALASAPRADGYDGQFYAALATDPWLRDPATSRCLDNPHYRATRIGLPLLAWLAALGNADRAVYAYQLLGWLLGILAVHLAAVWLAADDRSPAWALLLVPSVGLAASMTRCTPDAAALAATLGALWMHRRRRPVAAAVLLSAATLLRETSLLAAVAVAFAEARQRRFRAAAVALAAPVASYVAWQLYLSTRFQRASSRGLPLLTWPFSWLPRKVDALLSGSAGEPILEALGLAALLLAFVALVPVVRRFRRWSALHAFYAGTVALTVFLSFKVLVEAYAYGRALIALPFLALLLAGGEQRRCYRTLLTAVTVAFAAAGVPVFGHYLRPAIIARALNPSPTAAARPGAPEAIQTPAAAAPDRAGEPLPAEIWLLPIADTAGFNGARWRSQVELRNGGSTAATITVECVVAGGGAPPAVPLHVDPGGRLAWSNALHELFAIRGLAAFHITANGGTVSAWCRTYDASRPGRPEPLVAISTEAALSGAAPVRMAGLAHSRTRPVVRTNVGVLSLSPFPTRLTISLADSAGRPLRLISVELEARELKQLNDVFATTAPVVSDGAAEIRMVTSGGRFLAYSAVVSAAASTVRYVLPAAMGSPVAAPSRSPAPSRH